MENVPPASLRFGPAPTNIYIRKLTVPSLTDLFAESRTAGEEAAESSTVWRVQSWPLQLAVPPRERNRP